MAVFLSVWFATEVVYFSATGGMFHTYYLITLAPSVAALAGVGLALWFGSSSPLVKRLLALSAALSLGVEALLLWYAFPQSWPWMAAAAAGLVLAGAGWYWPKVVLAPLALLALAAAPTALTVANLSVRGDGSNPTARWTAPDRPRFEPGAAKLQLFLAYHPTAAPLILAVPSSRQFADNLIIQGDRVIPLGGFGGSDPVLSLSDFTAKATTGQIGFALIPQAAAAQRSGSRANEQIFAWVREHGRLVPPEQWKNPEDRTIEAQERPRIPGARDQVAQEDLYALAADIVL
jgi:4-amino-4-deoxy-L-arabinose transferase-like glycosyltransferase